MGLPVDLIYGANGVSNTVADPIRKTNLEGAQQLRNDKYAAVVDARHRGQ